MFRLLYFVFLCLATNTYAAKILAILPTPSVSHQVIFRPLTRELARRGHNVTVVTTDPIFSKTKSPENFTEIDVHDISYRIWIENFKFKIELGQKDSILLQMETMARAFEEIMWMQIQHEQVKRLIDDKEKFDLLLLEAWPRQTLIYSHLFKAPVIQISSLGALFARDETVLGAPTHPFLYPMMVQQRLYNLTFWEKIKELYIRISFNRMWYSNESEELDIFRQRYGRDLTNYDELSKNVDMIFINTHQMWMGNQPLPPNVISIWGIHKNIQKPLPNELESYLDSSKNGVVYLSFGSNALSSALPPEKIQLFVRVFSRLNYDVLWKWETDELPGKSNNIRISKWLPQSDLLRHPKIKLFITQGGLQSTDEAITAGVPMIGVPMLGDQWFNVEKYKYFKIGLSVDMATVTEVELENAIHTILNDTSFRDNIIRLRSLMKDQPENALDRAVWWTEYVLRNGGAKHLWAAGANMSWTEYYEVEFALKLASIILVTLILVISAVYVMYLRFITVKIKLKLV